MSALMLGQAQAPFAVGAFQRSAPVPVEKTDRQPETLSPLSARGEVAGWPDSWLIAAVRREPPDEAALDALVGRYWKILFARCEILAMDRELAQDLAQESWCRVLRARQRLEPEGNFRAYILTIATNLWRDRSRANRRAGAMSERQMASLDAALPGDGDEMSLVDVVPDPQALGAEEQAALKIDIDYALSRLDPQSREVVIARYIDGVSCAEIGRRHGRTEQTITAWLRQAAREMQVHLTEPRRMMTRKDKQ